MREDELLDARTLNGKVRAEIVQMLACMGRKPLAERAKVAPLVDALGMVFCELSEADGQASATPQLRERIAELETQVADSHGPLQQQVEQLNARIIDLNATIDAERAAHQKLQSAYTGACSRISSLLGNGGTHA